MHLASFRRVFLAIVFVLPVWCAKQPIVETDLLKIQRVTEVRITPDLRHATVYVARLGRSDVDALLPALRRASAAGTSARPNWNASDCSSPKVTPGAVSWRGKSARNSAGAMPKAGSRR